MINQNLKKEVERLKRAKQILNGFAESITNLSLDENFSQAISQIIQCKENGAKVVTTGMGKYYE